MFTDIDHDAAADAAARLDAHDIFDPLEKAEILAHDRCEALCRVVNGFWDALRVPLPGEDYWRHIQKLWGWYADVPADQRVTPMNAVNLCPEPSALLAAANQLRLEYNRNPSQHSRRPGGQRVEQLQRVRARLARGLGIDDIEDLAILRNASEGNNAINCGYRRWRRTDDPSLRENVVLWAENHPSNNEAWRLRAEWESGGKGSPLFDVKSVNFPVDAPEADIARAFIQAIDARTRFVTFTEVSNGNGMRIPEGVIRQIWDHIQKHHPDCHLHIDGTMSFGARPVNLGKPTCHSFISSAHKWFIGPKETGILYMHRDRVKNFMPSVFAYDYKIDVPSTWKKIPDSALRFELIGQRDDVNIIALVLTQSMWTILQPREPYKRVADLGQRLMEKLDKDGWTLVTPRARDRSWGIVRVRAPREGRSKNLYDWLYTTPGFRIGGSGDDETYRLSPHIYNTLADVDRAVHGMNEWRRSRNG